MSTDYKNLIERLEHEAIGFAKYQSEHTERRFNDARKSLTDAIAALVAERDRLAAANAELREDAAQDLEQITVERDAAVAQIARMKIAFKCERGHGTCSQIHDEGSPYHEPCDATNCQAMIDAAQEPKP